MALWTGSYNVFVCSSILGFIPTPLSTELFLSSFRLITDLMTGVDLAPGVAGAADVTSKGLRGAVSKLLKTLRKIRSSQEHHRTGLCFRSPHWNIYIYIYIYIIPFHHKSLLPMQLSSRFGAFILSWGT